MQPPTKATETLCKQFAEAHGYTPNRQADCFKVEHIYWDGDNIALLTFDDGWATNEIVSDKFRGKTMQQIKAKTKHQNLLL